MIRIGRVILNEDEVLSVVRDKKAKTTFVNMTGGRVHSFRKYWEKAWDYFADMADDSTL